MKKMLKGLFLFLMIFTCSIQTAAAATVNIMLNGQVLSLDTDPYIENGRVLVPVRGVLESLGYTIQWNAHTRTVLAMKESVDISLPVNSTAVTVNNESVTIDVPAKLNEGRTFVPLRFLAEYSGADVQWDAQTSTVVMYSNDTAVYDIADSVVYIRTNERQGSGVILTSNGLIGTNYHLIQDAAAIQFIFNNGELYQGETNIIGLDPQNDIALLKIEKYGLAPAFIASEYHAGDPVTAIGSPKGERNVSTTGVIEGFDSHVISSTAPIAPGNSGGGLFDASGKLIGINAFFTEDQYFAIPISLVQQVEPVTPFPLSEIENHTYTPCAPENLRFFRNGQYAYVSWAPIYDADYYHVYVAGSEKGSYQKLENPTFKTDIWYWGFPQSFGITINPDKSYYMKVSAVVDGVETPLSQPLRIRR